MRNRKSSSARVKSMRWKNDATRYGIVAQLLHWSVVVLIALQFALAQVAENLPLSPAKIGVLAQHKSIGITILILALLRLLWRCASSVPELPVTMKRAPRLAARASHILLYSLLITVPLFGWLMSSARSFPVSWFGIVTLPDLVGPDRAVYEWLHAAHGIAANALGVLALIHMAAALKHHFVDRDDVLLRMLPIRRERKATADFAATNTAAEE